MFKNQTIMVVHRRGQSQGIVISLNIKSKIQSIAIFITRPKSPRVIIRKGRVMVFIIGFTKKLSKPKAIPKSKIICHCKVKGTPKKFELENRLTLIPGTNNTDSQIPKMAAIICERIFFIKFIIPN